MATNRLLVVEDESAIAELISINLRHAGFAVTVVGSAEAARAEVDRELPSLVVLDWMLPGQSGVALCRQWRADARTRDLPVIMLTARAEESDQVHGLEVGADDYLSKPFDVEELVARIKALIRRRHGDDDLRCGSLWLDAASGLFYSGMRPLDLSPRESSLLRALLERQGKAVSKDALRESVFGPDAVESSEAVEVLVHRLRKRLTSATVELVTLRGLGYLLIDQASMSQEA